MLYLKNIRWIDPDDLSVARRDLVIESGPSGTLIALDPEGETAARCRANSGSARDLAQALSDRNDEDARRVAALLPGATGEADAPLAALDGRGRFATRGFACGHHHVYSALSRGMPPSSRRTDTFVKMLEHVWWRLDRRLDRDMIAASALAAALHCAKCGVTFIIDHHSSPGCIRGSLDTISRAFERVGIGHLLCYEISGRDGPDAADAGLEETDAWLAGRPGHVGLHASFTVDDALLRRAVDLARRRRAGVHIHVAESAEDQQHCLRHHGKRVVERLADAGALDLPHSLFAHAIHVDENERGLLRRSPGWVVQNTESNWNNRVGVGNYGGLPRVLLGTDGMHGDMLRSMRAVWQAAAQADDRDENAMPLGLATPYQRLRAAHRLTRDMNAPGDGPNNVVIFDYDSPTPLTGDNAPAHLIYGLDSRHVHTVIARGRVIVEDRRLTALDEDAALALVKAQARRLWAALREAG